MNTDNIEEPVFPRAQDKKGVKYIKQVKELKNKVYRKNNAEKVGKTLVGSRIRT